MEEDKQTEEDVKTDTVAGLNERLVMLSDILPILEEFCELDGDKYKETRKPTHGSCCTCQDCGHDHDSCVCNHNEIVKLLSLLPKFELSDAKKAT